MDIKVPDIGDFKDVPVIEIHVKPGDVVKADDSLVTLESDKATMDVPSPAAGMVKEVKVAIGDKVGEGSLVVILEAGDAAPVPAPLAPAPVPAPAAAVPPEPTFAEPPRAVVAPSAAGAVPPTPTIAILPPPVHMPSPAEIVSEMDGVNRTPARRCVALPASWASMWQK
jgi:pyruvate dehydrogenase E2 component (dihydrolipoamide acetyltransferase)